MRAAGEAHRAVVMSVSVGVRAERLGGKHTAPLTGRVQKKQLKEGRLEKKKVHSDCPKSKKKRMDERWETRKKHAQKSKKKIHEYFPLRRVIHYQGCVRRWWGRAEVLHAEATHSSRSGNPPQSKQKEQRQHSASANSAATMCPAVTSGTFTRCSCRQCFQICQLWNRNFVCVEDADLIVIQRAVVQQDIRRGHRHVFFAPCAASIPSNVEVGDSFRICVFQFT
ncbi:hypothetical protein ECC02_008837 [Trypanosoma cruzi]|uniref:Uncharacterized protein n=1 Tax=Trypanosoma cruzi TaxID=5693 RepID=A0A7J6XW78_TRYCR|nr:hypothetical protein ECC02_010823 [Trypanosoma cruzi]KAF5218260.1 hypothetical protein ECC02_008837 [Trypanosoma cruzi]